MTWYLTISRGSARSLFRAALRYGAKFTCRGARAVVTSDSSIAPAIFDRIMLDAGTVPTVHHIDAARSTRAALDWL